MSLARFWFAPGVEVFSGHSVPDPPPNRYSFVILEPRRLFGAPVDVLRRTQEVVFHLGDYSVGGEVAHYDLASSPPSGWRWVVVDGEIRLDRTDAVQK